jgi:signal transduction histidine kinase
LGPRRESRSRSVSDDGCGFDPEAAAAKKGLGFTSMRERLRLVGGEMQIHSRPLGGTRIEISAPLFRAAGPGRAGPMV